MSDDLSALDVELKQAVQAAGGISLETFPNAEMPVAPLDVAEFKAVVAHVRPRLVYLMSLEFDLDEEFEDDAADDGPLPEDLEALRQRYRTRHGACCEVHAAVVVDGVLHLLVQSSDWYDHFREEIAQTRAALSEASALAELRSDLDYEADLRERARVLAAHAAFSQGRPSATKRYALAEQLFRDLDPIGLQRVTGIADTVAWLRTHGLEPDTN